MKKSIVVIMILVFLALYGCTRKNEIVIGDSMSNINNFYAPLISLNSLTVFQADDTYTVIISENGIAQKKVEFSFDRKVRDIQGVTLLKIENLHQYLGKNINELKNNLGEFHADVGSGFYIPAYITEDAFLICFQSENDIIFEVVKRDLLSNSVVELVSE